MARILPSYIRNHLSLESLNSSRLLLQWIEKEGLVTQIQAAKAVGLSAGTCNLHFQKLEHMGLIRRADTVNQGRGRSTIIWTLDQTKNFCLLFVFDVPFFQAALVDFSGRVFLEKREDMTGMNDRCALEKQLENFVNESLNYARQAGGHIRQVFAGVPGIMDPVGSAVVNAVNFPVLNGMNFKELLQAQCGIPCFCESLGLAFYYGEIESLPPDTRALVLYWDLGVGAAAGIGERVVSHHHSDLLLSEFGHVRCERDGRLCHCGRRGCLEAYVGGLAMIETLNNPAVQSLDQFIKAVLAGDAGAVRVANEAAFRLGRNLYWVQQVTQSERLIVSGPLSRIFSLVQPAFIKGLSEMFNEAEIAALNPKASDDAQVAMQHGAFRLARRIFFHPEQ